MVKILALLSCVSLAYGQRFGKRTENHPLLQVSACESSSGCIPQEAELTIDANWRTGNCYDGNKWFCRDEPECTSECAVDGANQKEYTNTYGIQTTGSALELNYVTEGQHGKNIGSRVFLMADHDNYLMLNLKNKEFTFTVDASALGCGLNGALYFVEMLQDGGKENFGAVGAKYGTGYCDAQCPQDQRFINGKANVKGWTKIDPIAGNGMNGTCCNEIDVWEANTISTAFTMHACSKQNYACTGTDCGLDGVCDKNGCDFQSNRLQGEASTFWGPGSNFKIDSTKPVTVTTQFKTDDGTDGGVVNEVVQVYSQHGQTIAHSKHTVNGNEHDRITKGFCEDWAAVTKDGAKFIDKGGMKAISASLERGVVLAMSLWHDHNANMLWLDSIFPVGSSNPGAYRGSCLPASGVPKDVISNHPKAKVTFSDIKWGPLHSTTPSPSPTSGCCSWDGKYCGKTTDYCAASASQCADCRGTWCTDCVPPFEEPTPLPTPTPPTSDCPGGSLSGCLADCPAAIYAECATSCAARCAS